jgi:hypothetical protein
MKVIERKDKIGRLYVSFSLSYYIALDEPPPHILLPPPLMITGCTINRG